jgi:methyl-accepting chemotaxis protein
MKSLINRLNLTQRLVFFTLFFSIMMAICTTIPIQFLSQNLLKTGMERQLEIIAKANANNLQDFFDFKIHDIKIIQNSIATHQEFTELKDGFDVLIREKGSPEKAREYLRKVYILENPFPKSVRQKLKQGDNSLYSKAHSRIMPHMESILIDSNYKDLYIIDPRSGDVLFSVVKKNDYMTNLVSGQYKETNLSRLFKTIASSKDLGKETYFADFESYSPSEGVPAGFIGMGIFINGKLEGVIILQLSLDEINSRLSKSVLPNSGERSFLVGSDFILRSDYDTGFGYIALKQKIQSPSVREALAGNTGLAIIERGLSGNKVFNAYSPVRIAGNSFALIVEMDYEESSKGLDVFNKRVYLLWGIALILIIIISYLFANNFTKPIRESVNVLSTSIREISSVIDNHDKTAAMQSASVNETSTTLENISNSSKESAEESELVTSKAKSAQEMADAGHGSVEAMMNSIEELKAKVSSIADQILRLSEKNSQISNIISLVSELANETNMLALNAAVEAARAGENGKGFEVVAVEIRKLADESKKSALKIQEIIGEIKNATDSTVMVTEEGVKQAEESSRLGSKVLDSFVGISSSVNSVFGSTEKISTNIRQQSLSIAEIVSAMNSISKGSQETAMGLAETKVGADQIGSATVRLRNHVEGKK